MSPVVIDYRAAADARDVVHQAVQALAEGKLVGIPTETVYGLAASALDETAVARLIEVKDRPENQPLALAVKSADDALDYVPGVCDLSRRMARRCWPGPVTLVLQDSHPDSLIRQLPPKVQDAVILDGSIGLRVPGHPLVLEILRLLPGPLALTSANRRGGEDPVTAQEVVDRLNSDVDMVVDDGRTQFGQPSSVVSVRDQNLKVLREGVVSESTIDRLASFMVLLVCTGNTCRSPMAELLCRKRIADQIGCPIEKLEDNGVMAMSAGISAMAGGRPSPEAVSVMNEKGLDLSHHMSQPLTDRLVRHADMILTMTQGHRQVIVNHWPELANRVELVCGDRDVADPIGGPTELYRRCAEQIDTGLAERLADVDFTFRPKT